MNTAINSLTYIYCIDANEHFVSGPLQYFFSSSREEQLRGRIRLNKRLKFSFQRLWTIHHLSNTKFK